MDDLVDAIEDVLGIDDDAAGYDDGFGGLHELPADDGFGGITELPAEGAGGGGSTVSTEWYGTQTPYEAVSEALATQHATNLEVIDNIDGYDDYEYEVVTYP